MPCEATFVDLFRKPPGINLRVRGYGFALHRDMRVGFSERNGYRRVYRIGRWALQFLTPRS